MAREVSRFVTPEHLGLDYPIMTEDELKMQNYSLNKRLAEQAGLWKKPVIEVVKK